MSIKRLTIDERATYLIGLAVRAQLTDIVAAPHQLPAAALSLKHE